jgi:hypothetical protein
MSKKQVNEIATPGAVTKRLDALIRLLIEMNKPKSKEKFNEGVAARLLKSMDFTPTEIAKILGKKSATDVSQYLYPKKEKHENNERSEQGENAILDKKEKV